MEISRDNDQKHTYICKEKQFQNHSLTFIHKNKSLLSATIILSRSPLAYNTTASLDKLTCTDYVSFGKCQDRFGRLSWSKHDFNYLDVKLNVFRKDGKKEFRLVQNLTMGEADFMYPGSKNSFENDSVRKNLFLSACFCWDSRLSLREMDQKFKFGGTIGYGDSYLEFLFRHFKVFRLQAILHDAAGAVRAHSGKGPGYCYLVGPGPKSCLPDHVTGLLFCLHVKLFQPSIFKFVNF